MTWPQQMIPTIFCYGINRWGRNDCLYNYCCPPRIAWYIVNRHRKISGYVCSIPNAAGKGHKLIVCDWYWPSKNGSGGNCRSHSTISQWQQTSGCTINTRWWIQVENEALYVGFITCACHRIDAICKFEDRLHLEVCYILNSLSDWQVHSIVCIDPRIVRGNQNRL
jgi:hypothetical protein